MRPTFRLSMLMLCLPLLAHAQVRTIPEDAIKASMKPPANGYAEVGKYTFRLAPGVQIRSTDNRIVLPMMMVSEQLVRYKLDARGDLFRVWVLTDEEAQQAAPKQ
jgi:hypothetical protein